jgi:hypothetical protein
MPFKGNDFQYNRDEAYSALTYDKYGHEHDEAMDSLVDVENGARQYWAKQLVAYVNKNKGEFTAEEIDGVLRAAKLLDPYSGKDGADSQFAQTTLTDAPEGAKWVTPDVKK